MARQADTAHSMSGADRSNWNGRYQPINEPNVRGRAEWNGTLSLSNKHVVQPLQEMYANAGQQHDVATLKRYRSALKTLLHENGHLLTADGTTHRHGKAQVESQPATKALEEGMTELWAQRNLNRYIEQLGLEQVAPGISDAREARSYTNYTPAAMAIAEGIAEQSGRSPDEVIQRLNNVHAGQKWEVAAGMMCEANGLAAHVPRERQAEVTRNVARAMREGFEQNHPDRLPENATLAGHSAMASARREVEMYRAMYGGGDLAPGRQQNQSHGQDQSRGGSQLNDLDHAMALHNSSAPPLSTTRQLDASQFGSRRETGVEAAQPQRQGPELGK